MSIDTFSAHRHEDQAIFAPERTAVLVVDMLNEFCKPGGKMVLPGYEVLIGPQRKVIDAARDQGAPNRLDHRLPSHGECGGNASSSSAPPIAWRGPGAHR